MKRDVVVAGKAIGGAGLTGAVLYLVATVPVHAHVYWPYWVFLAMIVSGMGLYLAGRERDDPIFERPGELDGGQAAGTKIVNQPAGPPGNGTTLKSASAPDETALHAHELPDAAESLSDRFDAEWATDTELFKKLSSEPSFQAVSDAFRRGAQLGFISSYGLRAPLENTFIYFRIPHPSEWTNGAIPLHLEKRFMDGILIYEWTAGQSFLDAMYFLAKELRGTSYWEGDAAYYPEGVFDQFAKLLLYGIEAVRKGFPGIINRMFQIVGDDWIIAEWEIIDRANHYQILFRRFNELDWVSHVTDKGWVNRHNFLEAFETAEMLIHRQIFPGELPPDWVPPKDWPFQLP